MKKTVAVIFGAILIILLAGALYFGGAFSQTAGAQTEYLRIHVRANSNEQTDQSVKYIVKDEVVKFITPYAAQCVDKQTAIKVISAILPQIEDVCDRTLKEHGFDYTSKAQIRAEKFPTRNYGELTLDEGVYDALIVELGSGTGDNWWCVIYPPLCFTSATANVEYRSLIYDIIKKFFG